MLEPRRVRAPPPASGASEALRVELVGGRRDESAAQAEPVRSGIRVALALVGLSARSRSIPAARRCSFSSPSSPSAPPRCSGVHEARSEWRRDSCTWPAESSARCAAPSYRREDDRTPLPATPPVTGTTTRHCSSRPSAIHTAPGWRRWRARGGRGVTARLDRAPRASPHVAQHLRPEAPRHQRRP